MNWNIWKTTVKERAIIGDTMLGVFADLERAEVLLETVLDEHFLDREQKPIAASDADWTRSMLHIVNGISEIPLSLSISPSETTRNRGRLITLKQRKPLSSPDNARSHIITLKKSAWRYGKDCRHGGRGHNRGH